MAAAATRELDGIAVALPDGSPLRLRPIHRGDGGLLLDHFSHLDATARYRRFLSPVRELTPDQVKYFTTLDHSRHEGLFALDELGEPVGVARYITLADPRVAEVAVAVVDGWRHRGVGRVLVGELARRARAAGVERFSALMFEDNVAMRHLLAALGPLTVGARSDGTVEVGVSLEGAPAAETA